MNAETRTWMLNHHAKIAAEYKRNGNRRMAKSERRFVKRLAKIAPTT